MDKNFGHLSSTGAEEKDDSIVQETEKQQTTLHVTFGGSTCTPHNTPLEYNGIQKVVLMNRVLLEN